MKTIVPDYYPLFRCRADKCRHTCCAGWEIDIDEKTLDGYMNLPGGMGERLRGSISEGHFVLDDNERCPFLNASGLCDIITELGEGSLCQICSDHPRFRNFYNGRTEMGLGLTCEAAAGIILSRKEPVKLITLSDDGRGEACAYEERDRLILIAQDRSLSFDERLDAIAEEAGVELPDYTLDEWIDIYLGLERLDDSWTRLLEAAKVHAPEPIEDETALEQLLVYLIFRHVAEDDFEGTAAFALSSADFIRKLGGDILETARMWSSEIEYSDENIGLLTDACFDEI